MQLNPRENFTIVRQIEDHTDSSTYYVRAVIRNAKTDALIQVGGNNYLNLTDRGSRRFSHEWLVPADPSGQGFYISILTSVYTDSGYTTKSQNYGDKIDIYLVQDRVNPNLGGLGGGGGLDISYKKIREIIKEEIKKIDIPEAKVVEVTKEIIKEVKIPELKVVETEKVPSFQPLIDEIRTVGQLVIDKEVTEVPEQKEVDLTPIMVDLVSFKDFVSSKFEEIDKKINSLKFEVKLADFIPQSKIEPQISPIQDPRIIKLMKTK